MGLKIVMLGDSGVGKTSLLAAYRKKPIKDFDLTIGIDFFTFKKKIGALEQTVTIYDTAGSERFRSIAQSYYRSAMCALFVYDVTCLESYENVKKWVKELDDVVSGVPIILVGNKTDCTVSRCLYGQEGYKLASLLNADFYETNFHDVQKIQDIFSVAINNAYHFSTKNKTPKCSFNLSTKKQPDQSLYCC